MWLFGTQDEILGHKRRYSEKMIEDLASRVGLDLKRIISFNRISTFPWYINGKIFKKRSFSRFQIFVLELAIPLIKIIDKYLPWPSLSMIAILEKNPKQQ